MTVLPTRRRRLPVLGAAVMLLLLQACASGTSASSAPAR